LPNQLHEVEQRNLSRETLNNFYMKEQNIYVSNDLVEEKQREEGWPESTIAKGMCNSQFYKIFRLLPAVGPPKLSLL
jgi:hypothetical protein